MEEKFAITISRQFGSLGRPIAKRMAEILDVDFYDRNIVEKASKELKLPTSIVKENEESAKNGFFSMKFPLGMSTTIMQNEIFHVQKGIILETAARESAIFVGRCSEYILRNHDNCFRIYIYAPYEERVKNCVEILKMDEEIAIKTISEVDKARAAYHKAYTGYLPDDYLHQDIMIDSSNCGIEGTAEILCDMFKKKLLSRK